MEVKNAIELKNITKRFGDVVANDNINLSVREGEILAILGENGSGKTTLMNMLSGIYFPDEGNIFVDGKEVVIRSPKDSFDLGIGMIHQHFKLVDVLTAGENIVLGHKWKRGVKREDIYKDAEELTNKYGFELDLTQKIYDMSVSQKQTVEIVKVLYRGANVLILDEPTAVLTPQETEKLFQVLRNMKKSGKSIIIITHKLNEVLEISDRVTILRKGKYIDTIDTKDADTSKLTEMMVGEKVTLDINRKDPVNTQKRIVVEDLVCKNLEGRNILEHISFTANSGEILGIAGISGNGQKELLESIVGLHTISSGRILYYPPSGEEIQISGMKTAKIRELGINMAFVPEDRLGMGLVAGMDMVDNMMIRGYKDGGFFFADRKSPRKLAERVVDRLNVVTPGVDYPVGRLSGGNVQKVLVGREIASDPIVMMVAYPVRGLDINSSYTIYNLLCEEKEKGTAVMCVGEDLDVLMDLCDRIMVLCDGKISGIVDARKTTKEEIGLLMIGGKEASKS
ncbi:ABC transporter ATP-binding protein [Eubacterium oxidoreducens]|uniref:Simple sugar transport system ATP-binding protein n=1 Tax=Eubacterium oxidoreducens TaxID=1732 RepID=A0A1G6C458_EUBOX|nr:ABC transporter ATP-binding protein [Eubacterium oxidoreducens]SDB27656.1 simple sugar transport system ATP-binding protein [Eubacterium oxidoreducens]